MWMDLESVIQSEVSQEEKTISHFNTSVQFSSAAQLCPTLCNPMNRSSPGLPVRHRLLEFTQTHLHRVRDAISHLILCWQMIQMNLLTGQEKRCRHRTQMCGQVWVGGRWWIGRQVLACVHRHVWDSWWEPAARCRELSSVLCGDLDGAWGWEGSSRGRGYVYTYS